VKRFSQRVLWAKERFGTIPDSKRGIRGPPRDGLYAALGTRTEKGLKLGGNVVGPGVIVPVKEELGRRTGFGGEKGSFRNKPLATSEPFGKR